MFNCEVAFCNEIVIHFSSINYITLYYATLQYTRYTVSFKASNLNHFIFLDQ